MANITVLGAGGWGLALAKLLFENGHNVTVWSAVEREVDELNKTRENKQSLPGVIMPEG
ncbi:MAG: glycerol-3-phosphate dehydrogenase, partial [Parasporobacterium sp.]|nr:glycerol-3-phosphate dehydrogenase [Parasporobacterium sp.]